MKDKIVLVIPFSVKNIFVNHCPTINWALHLHGGGVHFKLYTCSLLADLHLATP